MLSRDRDESDRRRAAGTALLGLSAVAAAASIVLVLAAPALARLLSLGALGQPDYDERVRLIAVLLALVAPQVFLLAVTAVTSAVLTASGRLAIVGWSPVATNIAFISGLVVYVSVVSDSASPIPLAGLLILGLGSSVAVAVGTGIQLKAAARHLPPWRALLKARDRRLLAELRSTGGWTLLYAVANQVGLLVVLSVAARSNGVGSAYQWSFTVMQLPFALIGVTLLSATLPALARAADDRATFNRSLERASGLLFVLLLPCAAGLALFAPLLARLLVGYGSADSMDAELVAHGIALFAAALLPFAVFQLMTRSCYALRKPSWPAWTNVVVNAVTVSGALLALRPSTARDILAVLVLSYALSYAVGCIVLGIALRRADVRDAAAGPLRHVFASALATVLGVGIVLALKMSLPVSWLLDVASVLLFAACAAVGVLPSVRARAATTSADRSSLPVGAEAALR